MNLFGGKKEDNGPVIVGLTGQTGAGKSTVTAAFAEKGFVVIDCDKLTRELQSRPEVLSMLSAAYGPQILKEDGTLDRRMLAAIAFSDPKQTEKLGKLMFPPIRAELDLRINAAEASGKRYILLDAPTLFESGLDKICTRRISVIAAEGIRRERIIRRDGLTEEEATRRMSAQHPDAFYTIRSDFVLKNNGTQQELMEAGKNLAAQMIKVPNQDGRTAVIALVSIVLVIAVITGLYTITYRAIYPQEYTATAEEYAGPCGVSEYFLMALGHEAKPSSEEEFAKNLALLSTLMPGANETSLAAGYYVGAEKAAQWLADPSVSKDGVNFSHIPDEAASDFAQQVSQTATVYENLYS